MSFVPAKCCNCGANLQVNEDQDAAICSACGTPFVVEKAINYFISGNNYRSDYKIVAGVLKKYYGSSVDISIPEGVIEIGSYAFKGSSHLRSITFPSSLKYINTEAFCDCVSLKKIDFSDAIEKIGYCAFAGCSSLTKISLPRELIELRPCAFADCYSLESVFLPNKLQRIGYCAFSQCNSLVSITLPSSVIFLGEDVFWKCRSLKEITVSNDIFIHFSKKDRTPRPTIRHRCSQESDSSNNDRKKELLIIYDSKDEDVFKHISSLIMSEDDIDSEVVGLKDDSVIVYKCCFADYTKQKNMADKFLFVDCIPKNSNEKQLFSKYGISYGTIDDNKIYIKTDKAFSFDKDAYDSFLAELKSLADVPISEVNAYKKTEKIKSRSALNKGLRIASLAVAPTVGVALHIIDAGNETQARAMRRKQMLYYGLTRLYLDDLNTLIHD